MSRRQQIERSTLNDQRAARPLVSRLLQWFASNARDLPWRRTLDPYAIWISEIMLQQTQVKTVIPYWERWMRELPDARSLAKAPQEKVLKLWEGLGYYTRVRNLQKAATQIVSHHGGQFPKRFDEVLALAGIGRYTAGAICSIAFNQAAPILDGNVIRVLTRVFGISGDPRKNETNACLWALAEQMVGTTVHSSRFTFHVSRLRFALSGSCSAINQSLMELGALVCTPKQPRCTRCPLRSRCVALKENRVDKLPNIVPQAKATARQFVAFVVEHCGRWLVRQRPAEVVNAHLWEFPNIETDGTNPDAVTLLAQHVGGRMRSLTPLPAIKHSITRYRISLESFHVVLEVKPRKMGAETRWLTPTEVEALAFTSAHRKVWERLKAKE